MSLIHQYCTDYNAIELTPPASGWQSHYFVALAIKAIVHAKTEEMFLYYYC